MALSDVIRQRRTKLGLTQDQVAAALGVDRSAISQWEGAGQRNRPKRPDMDRIVPLAAILQLTVGQLLEEPGNNSSLKLETKGPDEVALLSLYRTMKPRDRKSHLDLFYTTAGFAKPAEEQAGPSNGVGVTPLVAAQ